MIGQINATSFFRAPAVVGLDDHTQGLLDQMVKQWLAKFPRNLERKMYLDAKNRLKDLKVAIPPELVDRLEVISGWPEKAVFEMSNRIALEGFVAPGEEPDPFGLKPFLHRNRFSVEFPQAVVSSLTYSTVFGSVTPGNVSAGEPEQLLMFHSALWATGLWDARSRSLRAGMLISDTDANGSPVEITLMLPGEILICRRGAKSWVLVEKYENRLARVPMESLPYRPMLDRPFGRSRIDRPVMSLTDRAMRTSSRLEVHSELFSAMKLLLLGVSDDAFVDESGEMLPLWSFYMGRLSTLSRDEEGELPQVEKITAESPEPHIASMRQLAAEFSGHTGVPLSSLGISTDNVESADAKAMTRDDIVADAERQHDIYGWGLRQLMENAVMLRDGLSEPPAELLDLSVKWRAPVQPTVTAQAMAGSQQVSAAPWLADTEVGLELLGLDRDLVDRAMSEKKRAESGSLLERVLSASSERSDGPNDEDV